LYDGPINQIVKQDDGIGIADGTSSFDNLIVISVEGAPVLLGTCLDADLLLSGSIVEQILSQLIVIIKTLILFLKLSVEVRVFFPQKFISRRILKVLWRILNFLKDIELTGYPKLISWSRNEKVSSIIDHFAIDKNLKSNLDIRWLRYSRFDIIQLYFNDQISVPELLNREQIILHHRRRPYQTSHNHSYFHIGRLSRREIRLWLQNQLQCRIIFKLPQRGIVLHQIQLPFRARLVVKFAIKAEFVLKHGVLHAVVGRAFVSKVSKIWKIEVHVAFLAVNQGNEESKQNCHFYYL
jgi:hypothetical protein